MSKTQKESFILYKDFYQAIKHLDDVTLGKLFKALYEYQVYQTEPDQASVVYLPFAFFKNQFRVDDKKYQAIVDRNRNNGKKGGRPPEGKNETQKSQPVKDKPKKPDTVTDTVTVTGTVTGTGTVKDTDTKKIALPFSSEKFSTAWLLWKDYKKKQFRFTFKSSLSELTALKKLNDLANGDEVTALLIMENSVAQGWKGFFKLDNQGKAKGQPVNSEYINELKTRLGYE